MSTTIAFDTLKMAARFESAGFSSDQAKITVTVLMEVIGAEDASIADRFSSKQDVALELSAIKAVIEKLDAKIDKSAAGLKAEVVRWVVAVGILQMALIAGLALKVAH